MLAQAAPKFTDLLEKAGGMPKMPLPAGDGPVVLFVLEAGHSDQIAQYARNSSTHDFLRASSTFANP